MPQNKNALIRYQVIDQCLRNTQKKWTLSMIKKKVEDALFEKEGIQTISIRTLQSDIFNMRSDKLGYNAPIKVYERSYYRYSDPTFKLYDATLSKGEIQNFQDALDVIKQFLPFRQFSELADEFTKLETNFGKEIKPKKNSRRFIQLDETEKSTGTHWITQIKEALKDKITLRISYQPFGQEPYTRDISPYILKEYNNRWFLLGVSTSDQIQLMALDRIKALENWEIEPFREYRLDLDHYFDNCIGVSKTIEKQPIKVVFRISTKQYNYLKTKPLHPSQKEVEINADGVIVSLNVIENRELRQKLLTFCPDIEILEPADFRQSFKETLKAALALY